MDTPHIPGLPPPEPEQPSSGLIPWIIAPPSAYEASTALAGSGELAGVIMKYPFIGETGNLAGVRFFEFFDAFRAVEPDLEALVQLVTIYPTRAVRLSCDVSQ